MTLEEAVNILKKDRALCLFNPMTGKCEPMNEDCRRSAEAYDIIISALTKGERDKGAWIDCFDAYGVNYRCSICGKLTFSAKQYDLRGNEYVYAYCPNCGAAMRGAQDDKS